MGVQHLHVRTVTVEDEVVVAIMVEDGEVVAEGTIETALVLRDVVLVVLDVAPTLDHVPLIAAHPFAVTSSHVPTAQWQESHTAVVTAGTDSPPAEETDQQHALPPAVAAGVKCIFQRYTKT